MKIIIPVDERNNETTICPSFGRAPYFLLYDVETEITEFLENSASVLPGGAGIKAAQFIVDTKADVVITPRCGENAAQVLYGGGIKLYKTIYNSAMENIKAFIEGKLSELSNIHPGFHKNGNN